MAGTGINIPEKRSAIDKIMQGLQVASSIYGIKSAYDQNKLNEMKLKEAEAQQRWDQGLFTPEEKSRQYLVAADHPLYKDSRVGTVTTTGERFNYLPQEKLKDIKTVQDITESMQKSQLEAEYRLGRVRPQEIYSAAEIAKGPVQPKGQGWIKKWDIENGRQVDVWIKPTPQANYFLSKEREANSLEQKETDQKQQLATALDRPIQALTSFKNVDSIVNSSDPNAAVPGAKALFSALKKANVPKLFLSGEIWKSPEVVQYEVNKAGPEAQRLWQNISNYMNILLFTNSGQNVTETEAARQFNAMGAHAFTSEQSLKEGLRNSKAGLFEMFKSREAPFRERDGRPKQILQDFFGNGRVPSSDDPVFDDLKKQPSSIPKPQQSRFHAR